MASKAVPTIGDMRRKAIIADAEIMSATETYLGNPPVTSLEFASGYVLDGCKTVKDQQRAKAILSRKIDSDNYRRTIVYAAVILAPLTAE
ncbi:hypothetical protein [Methylobacterium sp. J-076]|uniref:hypothetical protein n=1 Tax=Methylobacterium sp. J-076 TaxID=2836655 RepID=UPI001FB98D2B|nr:hypothetical protein [Methylobacterium sp. J-076]MCJ2012160.1 hypothetical protein [Methylobacterium sp. J-076]